MSKNEKLQKLQAKQKNWMTERSLAQSTQKKKSNSKTFQNEGKLKKPKPVVWSGSASDEFVVRKPMSSSRSNDQRSKSSVVSSTPRSSSGTHKKKSAYDKVNTPNESFSEIEDDDEESQFSLNLSNKIESFLSTLELDDKKTKTFSNKKSENNNDKYLSNHYCSSCNQLMVGEQHVPQIVFPCGHSFCSACLERTTKCLHCDIEITSVQKNSALESVICEFVLLKQKQIKEAQKRELQKYIDEINTVETRSNAMKSEASTIIDTMENITQNLLQERKDITDIKEAASSVKKEIDRLHERLTEYEKINVQKIDQCQQLESEYENNKKHLLLVEKTLMSLKLNKESLILMIEKIEPGYEFNEF